MRRFPAFIASCIIALGIQCVSAAALAENLTCSAAEPMHSESAPALPLDTHPALSADELLEQEILEGQITSIENAPQFNSSMRGLLDTLSRFRVTVDDRKRPIVHYQFTQDSASKALRSYSDDR